MQEIAVEHYESTGGIAAQGRHDTRFVREHKIEYLSAGEEIEVRTWVENIRRVRSLRRYEFVRKKDGQVLVKGETECSGQQSGVDLYQFLLRLMPGEACQGVFGGGNCKTL